MLLKKCFPLKGPERIVPSTVFIFQFRTEQWEVRANSTGAFLTLMLTGPGECPQCFQFSKSPNQHCGGFLKGTSFHTEYWLCPSSRLNIHGNCASKAQNLCWLPGRTSRAPGTYVHRPPDTHMSTAPGTHVHSSQNTWISSTGCAYVWHRTVPR